MIWKTGNRLIDNDSVVFYDMTAWQYLSKASKVLFYSSSNRATSLDFLKILAILT